MKLEELGFHQEVLLTIPVTVQDKIVVDGDTRVIVSVPKREGGIWYQMEVNPRLLEPLTAARAAEIRALQATKSKQKEQPADPLPVETPTLPSPGQTKGKKSGRKS